MNSTSVSPPAGWLKLFLVYASLTLLLVLPSATLWFGTPFKVLEHNFDYFCGLLQIPGWSKDDTMLLGRFVQSVLFAGIGFCFFRLATRYTDAIENAPRRQLAIAVGALLVIHFVALPWLNPDVFWAIGRGWIDAHYGLEPYLVPTSAVPHGAFDQMFQNIDPGLLKNVGNYGPLHHSVATLLAGLSGGNIKVAVFLFKLADLAFLLGSVAVVYKLAQGLGLKAQYVAFCYVANPIVPLVFLAWGHNDVMQNLLLLLAVLCVFRDKPLLSGVALGSAIAVKYVAIVLAPALVIYWLRSKNWQLRAALLSVLGLLGVVIYSHAMYEGAWETTMRIYTVGWSPIRSSIYYIFIPLARTFEWQSIAPLRLGASAAYLLSGAFVTFAFLWKRDVKPLDFAKVCVWIFNLYFILAAPAVLEWYITWPLGCLLLFPEYYRSFRVLYAFYMIAVPFTLYLSQRITYPLSFVHYVFFAVCVLVLMPWRVRQPAQLSVETSTVTCA